MLCTAQPLTLEAWIARLYGTSALLLLVSLVVFGVLASDDADSLVLLQYASKNHSVLLGSGRFDLSGTYISGLLAAVVLHGVVALAPSMLEHNLRRGRNPTRWIMLLFTAPALHTVTLVGITEVTDVWAVFASVSITCLCMILLFMLESAPHQWCIVTVACMVVVATFAGYWALAWRTTDTPDTFTQIIVTILTGTLVLVFAATYNWKADPYKREAVMQSATLLYELGMPWLWVARAQSGASAVTTWSTFMFLVTIGIAVFWAAVASAGQIVAPAADKCIPLMSMSPGADGEASGSDSDTGDPYTLEGGTANAVRPPFE